MIEAPYLTRDGRQHVLVLERERVPIKYKARGMFAKIYFRADGVPEVFAIVEHDTDYSKEIIARIWEEDGGSKYLPEIIREGALPNSSLVYRMPVYKTPLRKTDNPTAWRDFAKLKQCAETANRQLAGSKQRDQSGYEANNAIIECAADDPRFNRELLATLENLRDEAANYGSSYQFEFAPRNMATDRDGHLILLDVLFDLEAAQRKRVESSERKARRPW
jgi:hypothetical protein